MATKQNDAVSAVDNSDEDVFEDVFASPELLLEATKFDDANVSHDVELKIKPKLPLKKPLKTYSCSSCESGVSCIGSPKESMPNLKPKRPKICSCWYHRDGFPLTKITTSTMTMRLHPA